MASSRLYNYIRSRQLEGTYPGDFQIGAWITSSLRVAYGWGGPQEEAWPFELLLTSWPPAEPPGLDALAKQWRSPAYQRVRTVDDARRCLALLQAPVVIAVACFKQWFKAVDGVIEMPSPLDIEVGNHTIVLAGYDDQKERFIIRNSWGIEWGDQGYGYLPYEYIRRYTLEAWAVTGIDDKSETNHDSGRAELSWGVLGFDRKILHGYEIVDLDLDERLAWAFSTESEDFINIEELFVRPVYRREGLGTSLLEHFALLSRERGLALKMHVPHSDVNCSPLKGFIEKSGLKWGGREAAWEAETLIF